MSNRLDAELENAIAELNNSMVDQATDYRGDLRALTKSIISHMEDVLHRQISGKPTGYRVLFHHTGDDLIRVIKAFRTHTGLGLKTAKYLLRNDMAPLEICWGLTSGQANTIAAAMKAEGASVEVVEPR